MARYVEGRSRSQNFLLPESVDDYVDENNPVRAVEVFVDALDLAQLGFGRAVPAETGRPSYHPSTMLKIYLYGYLNRVQSSRRLEREAGRNLELIWLTGRLAPDFKTIADFRRANGPAITAACRQFVALCRRLDLFAQAIVAIDVAAFGDLQLFKDRVDVLIEDLRQSRRMPHVDRIWLPGEQSQAKRVEYGRDGIPISAPLLRSLDQLADDLRIERLT